MTKIFAALALATITAMSVSGCSEGNIAVLPPAQSAVYRLGSGDQLKITVYGDDKLTGTYTVNGAGTVDVPLAGSIPAASKTIHEFEDALTAVLRNGFINNPSVSVDVTSYRPYYILGEVNKPGDYAYVDGLSAFSAVARAGGFTYRASRHKVYIRHKQDSNETLYRLDGSTPISPGDTIRIPERKF